MFPEGTRSRNGQILPFKRGPFRIAVKYKLPIVITYIKGSDIICPPDKYIVHPGKFSVDFIKIYDKHLYEDISENDLRGLIQLEYENLSQKIE